MAKNNVGSASRELMIEAHRINYQLRSTFFLSRLREYGTLGFPARIGSLASIVNTFDWGKSQDWSIDRDAFRIIKKSNFHLAQIFCHPRLIRENSSLIAYYRNIAVLSQKSVGYLINVNVKKWECHDDVLMSHEDSLKLARLFNEHICLIINSSVQVLDDSEIQGLLLASTGAQIDGSWRNAIGDEAEKVVQRLLVKHTIERGILAALIRRSDSQTQPLYEVKIDSEFDIRNYRGIVLTNGTSLIFSSEPDITLLGKDGATLGVIEVKGGTDPAGALERYGAAKKSFESSLAENPEVYTILIASCITPEVYSRIENDMTIDEYFNLTSLLSDEVATKSCIDSILNVAGF